MAMFLADRFILEDTTGSHHCRWQYAHSTVSLQPLLVKWCPLSHREGYLREVWAYQQLAGQHGIPVMAWFGEECGLCIIALCGLSTSLSTLRAMGTPVELNDLSNYSDQISKITHTLCNMQYDDPFDLSLNNIRIDRYGGVQITLDHAAMCRSHTKGPFSDGLLRKQLSDWVYESSPRQLGNLLIQHLNQSCTWIIDQENHGLRTTTRNSFDFEIQVRNFANQLANRDPSIQATAQPEWQRLARSAAQILRNSGVSGNIHRVMKMWTSLWDVVGGFDIEVVYETLAVCQTSFAQGYEYCRFAMMLYWMMSVATEKRSQAEAQAWKSRSLQWIRLSLMGRSDVESFGIGVMGHQIPHLLHQEVCLTTVQYWRIFCLSQPENLSVHIQLMDIMRCLGDQTQQLAVERIVELMCDIVRRPYDHGNTMMETLAIILRKLSYMSRQDYLHPLCQRLQALTPNDRVNTVLSILQRRELVEKQTSLPSHSALS